MMARAIFWELAKPGLRVAGGGDTDETMKKLCETFGADPDHPRCPIELGKAHVFTLRGMGGHGSLFQTIADLIDQHGKIRVWGKN